MPDGSCSVSDIQDYIACIIKTHKTLTDIPPIRTCINRINNRVVLKIKDGYKLWLQTPETKLFGSKKKVIHKTQNAENAPSLEVVLRQWSLVDNQHWQKSEVLYTFMPNKSYE